METLIAIATGAGFVVAALALAALVVVAVLTWFLEHPVEEGEGGPGARRH